jgi:hypothetical protein
MIFPRTVFTTVLAAIAALQMILFGEDHAADFVQIVVLLFDAFLTHDIIFRVIVRLYAVSMP